MEAESKSSRPSSAPQVAVPAAPVTPRKPTKARRAYLVLFGLAGSAIAIYLGHGFLTRDEVSTDDAQVEADVVPITSRVGGVIVKMHVSDNQRVEAGALLAEIDDADYRAKVAAAQADLEAGNAQAEAADAQIEIVRSTSSGGLSSAKAQLQGTGASVRTAAAQIDAAAAALARANAELAKAQADLARAQKLHDAGAVSGQALEGAQATRDSAQAAVDAATANLAAAKDQRALSESRVAEAAGRVQQSTPVDRQIAAATAAGKLAHARVHAAEAALELAKLQLGYTKITAPVAGFVSRLAVHDGQMVQPGTTLVMVVPAATYVVANFKETQIGRIRPGDLVEVTIDAFPGTFRGKVDSVSAGTGARFSMMPPDNATGNFVKVVQRVPVKIVWAPDEGYDKIRGQLHAGLSAEVKVHLQH
jgi:membrane fusion protein, multidrug efflux system